VKKFLVKFAFVVSRIFDPVVVIPVILLSAVWLALTNGLRFRFLIFVLIVDLMIPAAYFINGLRVGWMKDWDATDRKDRIGLFFFTVMMHAVSVVYAFMLGKPEMGLILLVFWILAVIFAFITLFWKISVHAGVMATALAFFAHFWGWSRAWWVVILLLLVLWARVEARKHSWLQVFAGAGLAIVVVEVGLRIVGM
jgi:hypothetical protein